MSAGCSGTRLTGLTAQRCTLTVDRFGTSEEWREYYKTKYGPTIVVYRNLGDDLERVRALDRDLDALATRHDRGAGTLVMDWEYLLLTRA